MPGRMMEYELFFWRNDMNLAKALTMVLAVGAVLLVGTILISGCGSTGAVKTDSEPQVVQASAEPAVAFSFEDAAVTLL